MLSLSAASAFTSTEWWVIDGLMAPRAKQQAGLTEVGVTQVCNAARPLTIVNLPGDKLRVEVRRQESDGQPPHADVTSRWWQRVWDGLCYLLLVAWSTVAPLLSSSWSAWKVEAIAVPSVASSFNDTIPPPLSTLLPPCIPTDAFTVVRCAAYTMHSLIAASFLSPSHRVILLGDAAHLSPPYLGQALCLGIRDAASLAFRLLPCPALIAHCCSLADWEAERRGEAMELTVRSGKVGRLLEVRGEWQCWLRNAMMRAVDRSAWMKAAFQAEVAVSGRVLYAAGRRAMLVWPQFDDSDSTLLHPTAVLLIGINCHARRVLLRVSGGLAVGFVHFARLAADERWRAWLEGVGVQGAGVVVVRPDRYVLGVYAVEQQAWHQLLSTWLSPYSVVVYFDHHRTAS